MQIITFLNIPPEYNPSAAKKGGNQSHHISCIFYSHKTKAQFFLKTPKHNILLE